MLFSDIAMKINQRIENGEEITVDLDLDDGRKVTCATMIILTVSEKDYIVLLPLDKNGQNTDGNVWFYRYITLNLDTSVMMQSTRKCPKLLMSILMKRNLMSLSISMTMAKL